MEEVIKNFHSTVRVHSAARRLMLVRALRSIGQGMMVVDLALYLDSLGWSAAAIGGVLAAGGLTGVVIVIFVGVFSDRFGRKPFLFFYELLIAVCALAAVLSTQFILLFVAVALSGFGKAQSGAAGPFAPAEQAWLAAYVPAPDRGKIYSWNNGFGFFGMAMGAGLAGVTALLDYWFPGAVACRFLFGLIAVLSLVTAFIILTIPEKKTEKQSESKGEKVGNQEEEVSREENGAILKLASVNIINGIAVGLTGPMMSYWFAVQFGASNTQIGGTLAVTFIATGMTSILQARLSNKHGTIRSIVWVRILASLLLLLMPLLSVYALVSIVYLIRTALNRGTQGAQQALSVSLTRDERRGFASSVNSLSMRIPMSIGPYITGYLFSLGSLALPFFIASGLQFSFAYLYGRTFRSYDLRMNPRPSTG
ncbi:MAG TPA: MFS transporter [Bacillales bacterium]|nr:MFS transporter [Bacillales bacterium]